MAAVEDLIPLLFWAVALALSYLAYLISRAIIGTIDFKLPVIGSRPFHGLARTLENALVEPLHGVVRASERGVAKAFFGIVDLLMILYAIPILLADLVVYAAHHAWNDVLKPRLTRIEKAAVTALAAAMGLKGTPGQIAKATAAAVAAAVATAEAKILHSASAYADTLVRPIRAAVTRVENVALPGIVKENRAQAATITRLDTRVHALEQEVTTLEAQAGAGTLPAPFPLPVPAPAPIPIPVPGARGEPGTVGPQGIPGEAGAAGAPGTVPDITLPGLGTLTLGAAVAATYSVVSTLVDEAGLGRAECRGKVKDICRTDPLSWAHLLADAALIGAAFDFPLLVKVARGVVDEGTGLMRELV